MATFPIYNRRESRRLTKKQRVADVAREKRMIDERTKELVDSVNNRTMTRKQYNKIYHGIR